MQTTEINTRNFDNTMEKEIVKRRKLSEMQKRQRNQRYFGRNKAKFEITDKKCQCTRSSLLYKFDIQELQKCKGDKQIIFSCGNKKCKGDTENKAVLHCISCDKISCANCSI